MQLQVDHVKCQVQCFWTKDQCKCLDVCSKPPVALMCFRSYNHAVIQNIHCVHMPLTKYGTFHTALINRQFVIIIHT